MHHRCHRPSYASVHFSSSFVTTCHWREYYIDWGCFWGDKILEMSLWNGSKKRLSKILHSPYQNISISSIVTKKTWHDWLLDTSYSSTIGCLFILCFGPLLAFHLGFIWYFEAQRLGLTCVFKSNHVLQRCKSGDRGNLGIVPHGSIWHIMCLRNILGRGLVSLARIDLRSSGSNCVDMPILIDPLTLRPGLARDDLAWLEPRCPPPWCAMCASHRALATELKSLPTGYREARCLRLETNTRDFEALPSVPKDLWRMDNDMCRPFPE